MSEELQSELQSTINDINAEGKGILAADESTRTCTKRLEGVGIESTEENRLAYREMLFTTPGASEYVSGVILYEETLKQVVDGVSIPELLKNNGMVPGIKVDQGLVDLEGTDGEKVTQGIEGLGDRLAEYKKLGARFAKWRAVYTISDVLPSDLAVNENAKRLAEYAKICQDHGIVPIVEPEVLIDGDHSIDRCKEVTKVVHNAVFEQLNVLGVDLRGIILKPSMVISGKDASERAGVQEVAEATVSLFRETVPSSVPTINFLSGGQSPEESTAHLDAMNKIGDLPWTMSFSYGRALQQYALATWAKGDKEGAQAAFLKRAKLNSAAVKGEYSSDME